MSTEHVSATRVEELTALQAIFKDLKNTPYCTGTVPLDPNASTLFYRSNNLDSRLDLVDFSNPTDEQLENLVKACEPATFGMNQKDVYDEAYRKAGKMDAGRFAIQFQPANHGIIEVLRDMLLGNQVDLGSIRVELYKLNVYGPGGFFKAHVDTPRGDDMFGSLVIILPTVHEGGSLILRKGGKEWTFDSAQAVRRIETSDASQSNLTPGVPHAAFISFFSDVEHEVTPVSSGYRVTLTYNLYRTGNLATLKEKIDSSYSPYHDEMAKIKEYLDLLLKNPSFFPNGGRIGFGLDHHYAVNPDTTKLDDIEKRLKGRDEVIKQICESLSLKVALKAVYRRTSEEYDDGAGRWYQRELAILVDHFAHLEGVMLEDDSEILDYLGGEVAHILGGKEMSEVVSEANKDTLPIIWVKALGQTNTFSDSYIGYGNEPSLEYVYGEVCLVANVDSVKKRLGGEPDSE